jgi:DNA-binding NarL/FixJ family response regulator
VEVVSYISGVTIRSGLFHLRRHEHMQTLAPITVTLFVESEFLKVEVERLLTPHGDIRIVTRRARCPSGNDDHQQSGIAFIDANAMGFDEIVQVSRGNGGMKVIIVSDLETEHYVSRLLDAGVSALILRSLLSVDLVPAIRAVALGEYYFSSAIGRVVLDAYLTGSRTEAIPGEARRDLQEGVS